MFQAYYYKPDGPIVPAPWGILIMHWMWNTICSSWVFSNGEANRYHFLNTNESWAKLKGEDVQVYIQTVKDSKA